MMRPIVTLILGATALSCAPTRASRTIEPIEPGAPGATPTSGSSTEDFVLSREKKDEAPTRAEFPVHLEDKWYPFRAEYLEMTVPEVIARDRAIPGDVAPNDFWDQQTAIEAVSIWTSLCNECHGGRRQLQDALEMPKPPEAWGRSDGLFFGRKRPYVEIFYTITNGGPTVDGKKSEMPAWGKRLSREQIWSLIYFLEYQSGGIEGRFPPSLYPRRPEALD